MTLCGHMSRCSWSEPRTDWSSSGSTAPRSGARSPGRRQRRLRGLGHRRRLGDLAGRRRPGRAARRRGPPLPAGAGRRAGAGGHQRRPPALVGGPEGPAVDVAFDAIPTATAGRPHGAARPTRRSLALGRRDAVRRRARRRACGGATAPAGSRWCPAEADDHQVVWQRRHRRRGGRGRAWARATTAAKPGSGATTGSTPRYCRAVAMADGWLLASASTGAGHERGRGLPPPARRPEAAPFAPAVGDDGACPRAFPHNVDTFELIAAGPLVAVGTPTGELSCRGRGSGPGGASPPPCRASAASRSPADPPGYAGPPRRR